MKKLLTLFVAGALVLSANAQRVCGAMEHLHQMEIDHPEVIENRIAIEEQIQTFIDNGEMENGRLVVTIPVVVHVVYNTTAQNISDAQIQSQMTVLNNDFRKLNADVSGVPSLFASLAADCEINFCLAQRDPNGAATTGIERRQSSTTSWSTNDAVKYYSNGGLNAWPSSSYLNLWVCNLSGGVLGYAQFPGGAAATDGVVCTYTAFGTTGTATAPFNKGRTATHEVGHWLNLYHIWGDDGTSCSGSDLVSDTPNQADENYGCPSYPTPSCSNTSDMYMNYMDYTDDACMFMFTTGQKTRMQALFGTGGARASLLSSLGCQAPGGGGGCGTPSGLTTSSVTSSTATLSWGAVSGATSYTVGLKTSAAPSYTNYTVTGTSASFTGLTASTTYNWRVNAVCGSTTGTVAQGPNFTTLSGTSCTDAYESNNTKATAKTIPVNTNISALISTSTDIDWFKFTTTSPNTKVKITLSNLPADYDVVLYKGNTQVGIGQNGGTTTEVIKYNTTTTGTYYVKVYGYNGVYNATTCYTLNASVSSSNWKTNGQTIEIEALNDQPSIQTTVYPNPSNGQFNFDINANGKFETIAISVMDLSGAVVKSVELSNITGLIQQPIDLENLPNGIYIATIKAGELMESKKLILSH